MKPVFGSSVPRVEDLRLITGQGRYIDDLCFPGQAHVAVVRSPHAHAEILKVQVQEALESPGVLGVFTGADLAEGGAGALCYSASISSRDGTPVVSTPRPAIVADRARFAGDAVAVVAAETLHQARAAAELVFVEYDSLPAVAETDSATAPGAPLLWDNAPGNTCFDWETGDDQAVDRAIAEAHQICRLRLTHNRLVAAPMEPRGAVGVFDAADNRYHLHVGVQSPQETHSVLAQSGLSVPGSSLRVVVPDVGGGFGMKNFAYPEYLIVLWLAKRLGRPIKWMSDRSESFLTDDQGRGHVGEVTLALDEQGNFLAIRVHMTSNIGAYLTTSGSRVSTVVGSRCVSGPYRIPAAHVRTQGVFTNIAPAGSYRGAGKPEFVYMLERVIEAAASERGEDSVTLRRRNLITPDQLPYRNVVGDVIDSGDFPANIEAALHHADRAGFEERRRLAESRGGLRGFGIAVYAVPDGLRDGRARIVFDTVGSVTVAVSAQSNGQGHETAFAQIAAEQLGLALDKVRVVQGDTDRTGFGAGTGGSRSITLCGTAIVHASEKILAKAKRIAAFVMQVEERDVVFSSGVFTARGTNKSIDIQEVARAAYRFETVPPGEEMGLEATGHYGTSAPNFSSGCHVCEIEIERDTGLVRIVNYTCVDDFGRVVNPMLVDGQMHGGITQGIGQALYESCRYDDESGQLLTGSFMDYCLPRASDVPAFASYRNATDCLTNPIGVKACGEAGTVAASPAVMNAIADALGPVAGAGLDMPATAEKIWRAIQVLDQSEPPSRQQ